MNGEINLDEALRAVGMKPIYIGFNEAKTMTTTPTTITLKKNKDCTHSVRFDVADDIKNPIVKSVYINRPFSDNWKEVKITFEGFSEVKFSAP
jgi:hypothetical protein